MTINAKADHSLSTWTFTEITDRPLNFTWAPGSITFASSRRDCVEMILMFFALIGATRAAESKAWKAVIVSIACVGVLVAFVGLAHKALGLETVWGMSHLVKQRHFFAPFIYHAHAGAFMNLCLPLAMGLALSQGDSSKERSRAMAWLLASVILVVGVIASASKGAIAILFLLILMMLILNGRRVALLIGAFFVDRRRRVERMAFVVILWITGIIFVALGIEASMNRVEEFLSRFESVETETLTGRKPMMQLMIRMAGPEEGSWHGFGPGSFPHLVPYFTAPENGATEEVGAGRWINGHSDPLETVVQWGYLGAAAWFLIGIGAVGCAFYLTIGPKVSRREVPLVRGMIVSLTMVGLHSCVDFPFALYSHQLVALLMCGICWGLFGVYRREKKKEKALAVE